MRPRRVSAEVSLLSYVTLSREIGLINIHVPQYKEDNNVCWGYCGFNYDHEYQVFSIMPGTLCSANANIINNILSRKIFHELLKEIT